MSKQLRPLGLFGDPTGRDTVAGFSNHSICLQIPIELLTSNGRRPSGPTDPTAVVGIYANAMRPMIKVLRNDGSSDANGPLVQVSRLAIHSLWNSRSPADDIQYRQTEVVAPVPALLDLLYGTNTPASGVVARAEAISDNESFGHGTDSLQGNSCQSDHRPGLSHGHLAGISIKVGIVVVIRMRCRRRLATTLCSGLRIGAEELLSLHCGQCN